MTNAELINVLKIASGNVDGNIALAMLLLMAAERIEQLSAKDIEQSWLLNPDRSGGQFTEEEINRAGEWR